MLPRTGSCGGSEAFQTDVGLGNGLTAPSRRGTKSVPASAPSEGLLTFTVIPFKLLIQTRSAGESETRQGPTTSGLLIAPGARALCLVLDGRVTLRPVTKGTAISARVPFGP